MSIDQICETWARRLYEGRANLFYAGLPHPSWDELDPETKQNHVDYVEGVAAQIFNEGFQ